MNCSDTTSGCSTTNGNFKVINDGNGSLSGYAWGENTGWINFGPFSTPGISTVKIDTINGNLGGTLGNAGYAWSQNYGWIVFDCSNSSTCEILVGAPGLLMVEGAVQAVAQGKAAEPPLLTIWNV